MDGPASLYLHWYVLYIGGGAGMLLHLICVVGIIWSPFAAALSLWRGRKGDAPTPVLAASSVLFSCLFLLPWISFWFGRVRGEGWPCRLTLWTYLAFFGLWLGLIVLLIYAGSGMSDDRLLADHGRRVLLTGQGMLGAFVVSIVGFLFITRPLIRRLGDYPTIGQVLPTLFAWAGLIALWIFVLRPAYNEPVL